MPTTLLRCSAIASPSAFPVCPSLDVTTEGFPGAESVPGSFPLRHFSQIPLVFPSHPALPSPCPWGPGQRSLSLLEEMLPQSCPGGLRSGVGDAGAWGSLESTRKVTSSPNHL